MVVETTLEESVEKVDNRSVLRERIIAIATTAVLKCNDMC